MLLYQQAGQVARAFLITGRRPITGVGRSRRSHSGMAVEEGPQGDCSAEVDRWRSRSVCPSLSSTQRSRCEDGPSFA